MFVRQDSFVSASAIQEFIRARRVLRCRRQVWPACGAGHSRFVTEGSKWLLIWQTLEDRRLFRPHPLIQGVDGSPEEGFPLEGSRSWDQVQRTFAGHQPAYDDRARRR